MYIANVEYFLYIYNWYVPYAVGAFNHCTINIGYQYFRKYFENIFEKVCKFKKALYICINKNGKTMKTLAITKENNAKVKALRKVANTKWAGTTIHDTMDKSLRAICLFSGVNSGHYNPTATRINGLTGWFMINQDGSLFCEARVIKEDEKQYRIEYMTNAAWNEFENDYCNFIDEE